MYLISCFYLVNRSSSTSILKHKKLNLLQDPLNEGNGGFIAKFCMNAIMESVLPAFCWKSGGDVGTVPMGCPAGMFRFLAYEKGVENYNFVLGVCWSGWRSYIPHSITNFSDQVACPQGLYRPWLCSLLQGLHSNRNGELRDWRLLF